MSGTAPTGYQTTSSNGSEYLAHQFLIRSMLARVRTTILVQIKAVTNAGGVSAVGFVDVMPMVNQVDGAGNVVAHSTIYHCPYTRLQGGANAVILDPVVGDIGIACFADRDISSVIATRTQSNPGSFRTHDMADALYIGGCLNAAPTQYVEFNASGITLTSPTAVTINAPMIYLNGQVTQAQGAAASGAVSMQGPVTVANDVTANGTSLHTHHHNGVQTGSGSTGVPV